MRPWWLNTTKLPFQLAEMLCLILQPQRYDDCFVFFISIDEWFIRGKIGRFPLKMGWNLCSTSLFLIFSSKWLCFESICFKLNGFVSTWNVPTVSAFESADVDPILKLVCIRNFVYASDCKLWAICRQSH